MAEQHGGSCLCGAVTFTVSGALGAASACHCSQCRKQTGLYYASTNVATADLEVRGQENIGWYQSSAEARRGFCRVCGSALFWASDDADTISVMAGLFDDPGDLKIGYHIFCADKASFYEINDGLPQYPQSNPPPPVAVTD